MGTLNTPVNFKGLYWVKIIKVFLNHQTFFKRAWDKKKITCDL